MDLLFPDGRWFAPSWVQRGLLPKFRRTARLARVSTVPDTPPPDDSAESGLLRLALLAVVGGVLTGLAGGLFRYALVKTGDWWIQFGQWARELGGWRLLLPVLGAAVAVGLARLVVRWAPESGGSGIQRVEATVRHEGNPSPLRVVPAKFVGGTLAIGVGMALGREGPTVQMGATIGSEVAKRGKCDPHDVRTLGSAMAGAGLGVAFSAPLGGSIFVLEELDKAIRTRLLVAVLIASSVSLAVAYPIVGRQPVLPVREIGPGVWWELPFFVVLGVVAGVAGRYYNRLVVLMLDAFEAVKGIGPEIKAAVIGAVVGLLGVVAPWLVGGGEALADRVLNVGYPLSGLVVVFVVRWFLGPLSYSAGTPGGLFAPLLVVGAAMGGLLAGAINAVAPGMHLRPEAFAIVGMTAFFAAVVRSPLTGIALCTEMTATTSVLVPMLLAAGTTMIVSTLVKSTPIYDMLRLRMQGQSVRY